MRTPYRYHYRLRFERREPWLLDGILAGLIIGGTLAAVVWMRLT